MFAFDEFGPLGIRPTAGSGWATQKRPDRLPATSHRTHGLRYFHGCYSVGDYRLWGANRRRKGAGHTLAALNSIRAGLPCVVGMVGVGDGELPQRSEVGLAPATATSWLPNARNMPVSAAKEASAGAVAPSPRRLEQLGEPTRSEHWRTTARPAPASSSSSR
nr:hypothetical protein [Streptomyces lavenduligriseus]